MSRETCQQDGGTAATAVLGSFVSVYALFPVRVFPRPSTRPLSRFQHWRRKTALKKLSKRLPMIASISCAHTTIYNSASDQKTPDKPSPSQYHPRSPSAARANDRTHISGVFGMLKRAVERSIGSSSSIDGILCGRTEETGSGTLLWGLGVATRRGKFTRPATLRAENEMTILIRQRRGANTFRNARTANTTLDRFFIRLWESSVLTVIVCPFAARRLKIYFRVSFVRFHRPHPFRWICTA